jgi:predicted ribosome quality control (RQC) complex YloA/Tae2 family protein
MKLDSIALSSVISEIKEKLVPAKITEIYQINKYEILLFLKKNKYNGKLFFSLRPDMMAFFLSDSPLPSENFSSLFFNHLQNWVRGGTLIGIQHYHFDRIIRLVIQPYHKFGTPEQYYLMIEFMGKHSNAILIDENNIIKTSLKQVGLEVNRYREIKPGTDYIFPPRQEKYNPLTICKMDFIKIVNIAKQRDDIEYLWQFFLNYFYGISIKSSKEIVGFMGFPQEQKIDLIVNEQLTLLWEKFFKLKIIIKDNRFSPVVLIDKNTDQIIDYSLLYPINTGNTIKMIFENSSPCLEFVFNKLKEKERKQELFHTINRILKKNINKIKEKRNLLQQRKKEIENSLEYKKKGELIKANLWNIKSGIQTITVVDYADKKQNRVTIDLDPNLSPVQNAKKFFKKYKKLQQNKDILRKQINENKKSLQQLKKIQLELTEDSDSLETLSSLYNKLVKLKYIHKENAGKNKRKKEQGLTINKFFSPEGWVVLVGKNNKQNEYILRHLSSGNDFWLHNLTKPGSHVIIKNHKNIDHPPYLTLHFAARLAGYYSKSKDKENAIIIYTQRKYVKKPKNAKPGKVIYSNEKTLTVLIDFDEIKKDINRMLVN